MPGFVVESPVWRLQLRAHTQDDLVAIVEDIAEDCRRTCPVDSGALLASIHTTFRPGVGKVHVGTDHWAAVEYGSEAHEIRPRNPNGALAFFWERKAKFVVLKSVRHPGTPAQPFLRASLYRRRRPRGLR